MSVFLFLLDGRTLLLADDVVVAPPGFENKSSPAFRVGLETDGMLKAPDVGTIHADDDLRMRRTFQIAQGTTVDDQDLEFSEEERNGTRSAPNDLTLEEIRALFKQLDQLFAAHAAKTELLNCSLNPRYQNIIEGHLGSTRLGIERARQTVPIDPELEKKWQSFLDRLKAAGDKLLVPMKRLEVLAERSKLNRSSKCADLTSDATPAKAGEIRQEMAKVQDQGDAELARVKNILSAFSVLSAELAELSERSSQDSKAQALAALDMMRRRLNNVNSLILDASGVIANNDAVLNALSTVRGQIEAVLGRLDAAFEIMSQASPPIPDYGGLEQSLAAYRANSRFRSEIKDACSRNKSIVAELSRKVARVRTLIDDHAEDVRNESGAQMSDRQADAIRSRQSFKSGDYLLKAESYVRQISDASGKLEQCIVDIQRAACDRLLREFDTAAALIDQGALASADKALLEIDAKSCPALVPRIAGGKARIARLVDNMIAQSESASKTCDADTMAAAVSRLEHSSHPRVAGILDRKLIAEAVVYTAHSRFETAQGQFTDGDFTSSIATLKSARSALDRASGDVACDGLVKRIAAGILKAERLYSALGKIDAAMTSCDAAKITGYSRQMKSLSKSHPLMRSKIAELDAMQGKASEANSLYEAAKSPYADGDVPTAREHLGKARVVLSAFDGSKCAGLGIKISKALDKIQRLETALARADAAIGNCSLTEIANWLGKFEANPSHALIRAKIPALGEAHERCERLEDAGGFAEKKTVRDARCVSKHGPGNHAGPVNAQGKFYCLPTKKTANARCRKNQRGSGWYAGEINAWGGFKCRQSVEGQEATATANCQQYRKPGERLKRVYRKNGEWWCQWQTARKRTTNRNRKPTRNETQGNCPKGHVVWGGKCVNVKPLQDALAPVGNICASGDC